MPLFQRRSSKKLKLRTRRNRGKDSTKVVIDALPIKVQSLGCGTFDGGIIEFAVRKKAEKYLASTGSTTCLSSRETWESNDSERIVDNFSAMRVGLDLDESNTSERRSLLPDFERIKSTFLRVADLQITVRLIKGDKGQANFHHASVDPPPGIAIDPMEQWVALDDGEGSHAPIAPFAVAALARFGLETAMDQTMWKAESKTDRVLKNSGAWKELSWQESGEGILPESTKEQNEVLVWSGNFVHGLYGSDLPAARAAGVVDMSAKALCDLLLDSNRVKEYNKLSLGRTDLLVLQDNMEEDGPFGKSITKVVRSESKPPLVRKTMQLVSMLYATELADKSGYLIVSRAVTEPSELRTFEGALGLRSEILMGVNVIRRIKGHENKCLMVNVNHIRSPMIPMMIARKLGLTAASNFIAVDLKNAANLDKQKR